MRDLRRCWINQPSTHQPDHRQDGTNVLADFDSATRADGPDEITCPECKSRLS